jgi:hypothetical protein
MAAHSAAKTKRVLLIEESKWIGGQLTSQAVPPDEHAFIESFGATKTYQAFRKRVRDYMKLHFPVKEHVKTLKYWNPGHASVTRLSAPPIVFLHILNEMLIPFLSNGNLSILTEYKIKSAKTNLDMIEMIEIEHTQTKEKINIEATYFLDATDQGELLPLTKTEYVQGRESFSDTEEKSTLATADFNDLQPITWVACVDYVKDGNYTIEKPLMYDEYKKQKWPCDDQYVLSWYGPDSSTGKTKAFKMFLEDPTDRFALWPYRRIIQTADFEDDFFKTEATLINWPQNDYIFGNIDSKEAEEKAKQLTLSLIYYLQTEAPRPDGGFGYPGIRLRGDLVGTKDGLAMMPYIRESRRIIGLKRVREQDISTEHQHELPRQVDSVGVGCYHIDLHMTTQSKRFFFKNSWPFEIPLGAFIPIRMNNLLPACKNIATTQLTNGAFRLHPIEWNIGEVAGYLASKAIDWKKRPRDIYEDKDLLTKFQSFLDEMGIERSWPKDKVHPI